MFLAGDIGGTKTVLALFEEQSQPPLHNPVEKEIFPSDDYESLEAIVSAFLTDKEVAIQAASFGVAGPVVDGKAQITNLPWLIDTAVIQTLLNIPIVGLLNDLESIANAVPYLDPKSDLTTLNEGVTDAHGAIAVIAPGTGLGEAFLVWERDRYEAHPSEGGHASFAPNTAVQRDLLTYMTQKLPHVSFERVCSGSGIPNLYNFLRDSGRFSEPTWLRQELEAAEDKTPIIVTNAVKRKADICMATLNLFIEILAGETANMALKVLATGGVYLGGGIPPRILPQIEASNFMDIFIRKGRFTDLLSRIPIHVIRNPEAALFGAAYHGLTLWQKQKANA